MIAYFDTSALVPLLIEEPGSAAARTLWDGATRVCTVSIAYAEARAAIAQARRIGRLDRPTASAAVDRLDEVYPQIDLVAVDEALVSSAGSLAGEQDLRGYDAVHLAAAWELADGDLVVVASDRALVRAVQAVGLAVAQID